MIYCTTRLTQGHLLNPFILCTILLSVFSPFSIFFCPSSLNSLVASFPGKHRNGQISLAVSVLSCCLSQIINDLTGGKPE